MRPIIITLMGVPALTAFFLSTTVQAAPQTPQAEQRSQGQPSKPLKEETLDQFANAQVELNQIHQQYQQAIQWAGNSEKKEQLQQKAGRKMHQAIESQGFSVKEYSRVAKRVRQNAELRKEIQRRIQAVQSNQ